MKDKITVEDVFVMASSIASQVLRKMSLANASFGPEDVVSEYMVRFIENKYVDRFNEVKGSLKNYVYQGLKNTAINMSHKYRREFSLLEDLTEDSVISFYVDSHSTIDAESHRNYVDHDSNSFDGVNTEFLVQDLVRKVGDFQFGHDITVVVNGETLPSTLSSVLKLLSQGFTKAGIAKLFKVSEPTIANVFDKVKNRGLKISDIRG
jgi:DNA-directed RNA polymerase specialized sigma24 family protein